MVMSRSPSGIVLVLLIATALEFPNNGLRAVVGRLTRIVTFFLYSLLSVGAV